MTQSPLQRIAAGRRDAICECISKYRALVWSMARRTPADAEDATQEILLDIWRDAARFDSSKGTDKVFITVIARRRLIDCLRKVTLEPPWDSLEVLDERGIHCLDLSVTSSLEDEQVVRAILSLRREQREVLELSPLGGLSQSEIAIRLVMPLGTVKSFMRRGLTKVREFTTDRRQPHILNGNLPGSASNSVRSALYRAKSRISPTPVAAEGSEDLTASKPTFRSCRHIAITRTVLLRISLAGEPASVFLHSRGASQ